ncbi:NAD(P)/FAD-dependent oxidoreductase [Mycetocola reblochoni]|uniref:Thioredoxin reductase n=2 Tax=Mycetocola reblochoni TaxID=331618 RepID=A0A1R4IHW1_9MICO|nr:NAD(P)/FAD-dependent oxidoreductase [Mycetocola reblochoni]RLP69680.1 pyridine nucleotide-disulfide oxidoreductase [Mycetocola reblochoni]SJN19214.1 Thioredoxin reductase [Mycetocola reblochoni REB411]
MTPEPVTLDALVIGAGPAGVGVALALDAVDGLRYGVLERGAVGQTFLDWPQQLSFLTPSFTGNGFGATDLNAVHPQTSPAFSLGVDYPTGAEYARYLRGVVAHFGVPILANTEVTRVERHPEGFAVESSRGPVLATTLIWAGGEFAEPLAPRVAGAGLASPVGRPAAWEARSGRLVVIGGYESGLDVACHHAEAGVDVSVVDAATPWDAGAGSDPSYRLAPRTRQRLERVRAGGHLTLVAANAAAIKRGGGVWGVSLDAGSRLTSDTPPVLATGYGPGLGPVAHLVDRRADGWPLLDDDDQSTLAPGLFLAGPAVRHGGMKFCFVYKFRQRFAHVAGVIGSGLGLDVSALEAWRDAGMLTDDLSCCGVECAC